MSNLTNIVIGLIVVGLLLVRQLQANVHKWSHTHAPAVLRRPGLSGTLQAGERPGRQAGKSASRPAGSRPAKSIVIRARCVVWSNRYSRQ
jgi:hypothetical protein